MLTVSRAPFALLFFFFFSSRRRHTRSLCDWSSDVCSSDLRIGHPQGLGRTYLPARDRLNARPHDLAEIGRLEQRESNERRSEERRVGKECRSRWSPYD